MSNPDRPAGDTVPEIDAGILDRMIEIRRHLHRHPELSNREVGTQRYLREMLASEGIAEIRDLHERMVGHYQRRELPDCCGHWRTRTRAKSPAISPSLERVLPVWERRSMPRPKG